MAMKFETLSDWADEELKSLIKVLPADIREAAEKVYDQIFLLEDPEFLLVHLDEYEGIDPQFPAAGEYVRKLIPAFLEDENRMVDTWFYHFNQPSKKLTLIESGRYLDYYPQKPAHLDFIRTG